MFDQKLYQETFDQVTASEETLSEVLNMTKNQNHHYGRRFTRMLVIAAVITVMLATTAFAYVGFTQYESPIQMLDVFFGAEEYTLEEGGTYTYQNAYGEDVEVTLPDEEKVPLDGELAGKDVAPYVSDVGKSITCQGDTLTVEAHLYDSATDCGVIYYKVENPDGVRGYKLQSDGEVRWPGVELVVMRGCSGKNYIIEEETTETCLSVAHYYCSVYEEYIEACFGAQEEGLMLPLTDGGGMGAITLAEGDIKLSPISMLLNVEKMGFLCRHDTDGTLLPPMVDSIRSLSIRFRDGTEYIVDMDTDDQYIQNYTYSTQDMDNVTVRYTFNRLIDIDQVEAVIINDVEFNDVQAMDPADRDAVPETAPQTPAATEPANH